MTGTSTSLEKPTSVNACRRSRIASTPTGTMASGLVPGRQLASISAKAGSSGVIEYRTIAPKCSGSISRSASAAACSMRGPVGGHALGRAEAREPAVAEAPDPAELAGRGAPEPDRERVLLGRDREARGRRS